jgi:membrane-associated phospholipid phosphatase
MQSLFKLKVLDVWSRISFWVGHHKMIARLVSLMAGLILFLVFLPPYMRVIFWDDFKAHKILAIMLLVFSLLVISLLWTAGQKLDDWVFLFFNFRGSRPIWLDKIMLGFTQIGSGIVALGIALILFFANNHLMAYEIVLGTVTLWLLVELMKFFVYRSRPFILLTQARIVGLQAIGRSFPSGHTSHAFFMATLLAHHYNSSVWIVILLYIVASLVGITRMYVGAHYPRDVLAGAILGSAWGLIVVIVNENLL